MTSLAKENDIDLLNASRVKSYLLQTGWSQRKSRRENVGIFFREVSGKYHEVLLPLDRSFSDYKEALEKAILKIGASENTPPETLLNRLVLPFTDVLSFRVDSAEVKSGTVSLEKGIEILENAKRLLLSAASDIERPQPYHPRMAYRKTRQMIERCRLGQTEEGSFVINIHCPVDDPDSETPIQGQAETEDLSDSFSRKATLHLMSGIARLGNWYREGCLYRLEEQEMVGAISSNFIDALVGLYSDDEDSKFDISIKAASVAPIPDSVPQSLDLKREWLPEFRKISERLKTIESFSVREFVGRIISLKADPNNVTTEGGQATISTSIDEKPVRLLLNLDKNAYQIASVAHPKGQKVIFSGRIRAVGKRKTMTPFEFRAIDFAD